MKSTKYLFIIAAALSLAVTGCQKSGDANANAGKNTNTAAVNTNANAAATPAPTPAKAESTSPMSLATPADAYKTAYTYRKTKDIEGLKRVMTKDILEFLTEIGKEDKKSLDDMLMELANKPQADKAETRNEKITGDRATIEYLDEAGKWSVMDFEKVGSEWKLSFPKADADEAETPRKK